MTIVEEAVTRVKEPSLRRLIAKFAKANAVSGSSTTRGVKGGSFPTT